MQLTFNDAELAQRAHVAITTWYRTTIETVGKAHFSTSKTTNIDGPGLVKIKQAFDVILNGVNFETNINTEIGTFTVNATRAFLNTQPAQSDPTYAAHPLTVLKSRVSTLAAPAIDAAVQTDLPPVVAAKLDELISPASIAEHVNTILTPALVQAAVAEVLTPQALQTAVSADLDAAVDATVTAASVQQAVETIITPAFLQSAIAAAVNDKMSDPVFVQSLTTAAQTYINDNATQLTAQIAANELNQAIDVMVNGVIANTVMPTLDPNAGTVTP